MPVIKTNDHGIETHKVTGAVGKATAEAVIVPGVPNEAARMQFTIQGTASDPAPRLQDSPMFAAGKLSANPSTGVTTRTIDAAKTTEMLEKLGLPKDLGGKAGVEIKVSHDAAHNTSSVIIESRDRSGKTNFVQDTAEKQGDAVKLIKGMAQESKLLPDEVRKSIIKANPELAARVVIQPKAVGGTQLQFDAVDSHNMRMSIGHDAATRSDVIKLPPSNNPGEMAGRTERILAHLKAHGIEATSNIEQIQQVAAAHKGNPVHIAELAGSPTITLPKGMGEQALMALGKPAEFKIGNTLQHSAPIIAPEIANVAKVEVDTVRKAAHTEHVEHQHANKTGKGVSWGGIYAKIAVALTAAAGTGLAAASEAPEGERLATGAKVGAKALVNGILPGAMEEDTCKKRGEELAYLGAAVGGGLATGATVLGVGLTAVPTAGASVAASPYAVAAAGFAGAGVGGYIGSALGEGVCKLARAATQGISSENMAHMKHKPTAEQNVAAHKAPDQVRVAQSNLTTAAGRG